MIEPSMGEERVNGYMDDNKKERLMISIITIACLGNIAETLVAEDGYAYKNERLFCVRLASCFLSRRS